MDKTSYVSPELSFLELRTDTVVASSPVNTGTDSIVIFDEWEGEWL